MTTENEPTGDLDELVLKRENIEREIRWVERDLLEPYVGRKCLSTTFLEEVAGTLEAMDSEELPDGYTAEQLLRLVHQNERWKSLKQELDENQAEFETYLAKQNLQDTTYKAQIQAIRRDSSASLTSYQISKLVGSSEHYSRSLGRPREGSLDSKLRQKVLARDAECIRCGSESGLEVHHITPVSKNGESILDNLAALCHDCHFEAHERSWNGDTRYDSHEEFWSWAKGNK